MRHLFLVVDNPRKGEVEKPKPQQPAGGAFKTLADKEEQRRALNLRIAKRKD